MLYRDDDVVCGDAVPTLHLHLQLAMLPPEPECIGQLTAQEATREHSDGPAGETGKQAGAELSQAKENYFCWLWLVLVKIDLHFTIGARST